MRLGQRELQVVDPTTGEVTPRFADSDDLWSNFLIYREWADQNPLLQRRMKARRVVDGDANHVDAFVLVPADIVKPRVLTIMGFMEHCGCTTAAWEELKSMKEFEGGVRRVTESIRTNKFELAAAELLSPMLISRDLELAEKVDLGGGNTPIRTLNASALSSEALEEILKAQDEATRRAQEAEDRSEWDNISGDDE